MTTTKIPLTAAALVAIAAPALAFRSGPPSGVSGSPGDGLSCMLCHGSATGGGSVQILGAPTRYTPGRVYTLRVRIADPVQAGAGFELTVEDSTTAKIGTLLISDSLNTQYADGGASLEWIEHTSSGVDNTVANWAAMGNAAEYEIRWQAPGANVGPVTFYAAGNAINNNFNLTGDIIYLTNVTAQFNSCPADLDGDGQVGASDLAQLLGSWGPGGGAADLDGNGSVNAADLALLLGAWGACP